MMKRVHRFRFHGSNLNHFLIGNSDICSDRVFSYKPHVGPVSELLTGPHTVDKLFSSCYDGSVRVMVRIVPVTH